MLKSLSKRIAALLFWGFSIGHAGHRQADVRGHRRVLAVMLIGGTVACAASLARPSARCLAEDDARQSHGPVEASSAAVSEARVADAAERADGQAVARLLESGADPRVTQPDGTTAVHWAAYHEDPAMLRSLLAAKAPVDQPNRFGVRPLLLACENGNGELIELLLAAGADPKATGPGGETPLMTAARSGSLAAVELLLRHGAVVNARDRRGQTAVMWAAAEGHASIVRRLIAAGADFRTPLKSGFTPLFFAVREGHRQVVRVLLQAGADVNEVMRPERPGGRAPRSGMSPLMLAVENGHFELAVDLLRAGADPNDQRSGFTALHAITWVRKPDSGDDLAGLPPPTGSGRIGSLQFVKELVRHGADVNARLKRGQKRPGRLNPVGQTPFFMACDRADVPLMKLLLELGADPTIPNADGTTPLMAAAGLGTYAPTEEAGTEEEMLAAVKLLLDLGADIDAVDANGETAMHGAAYSNAPRVVALLAARGADPKVWMRPNKYGWTPLTIAEGYRFGNFKPSRPTVAALRKALLDAGITPPPPTRRKPKPRQPEYSKKSGPRDAARRPPAAKKARPNGSAPRGSDASPPGKTGSEASRPRGSPFSAQAASDARAAAAAEDSARQQGPSAERDRGPRESRPNVLLILVDDLKPAFGAYGASWVHSPNLDRLAARGLRFDFAYCNQAVCAPSRNNLLTGARSTSLGIYNLGTNFRNAVPDAVTLPQHFKQHGYFVAGVGKVFHIGHGNVGDPRSWSIPFLPDRVIDYAVWSSPTGRLSREEALFSNRSAKGLPRGPAWEIADVPDVAYADGRIAAAGIRLLREAAQRPEPFFLALGFVKPHLPFCAPRKYWELYDPSELPLPTVTQPPVGAPPYAGKTLGELNQYEPVPREPPLTEQLVRQLIHGYFAAVSYVDAQIGKVLDELDRRGLRERTIVVLWGDHGWHLGDHGMWTKHTNYEQAVRIPLIVVAPGVTRPGTHTDALVETVDIYPTLCELAGVPVPGGPQPIDGKSFVPVLRDPLDGRIRDHVYHCYPRGKRLGRAIRTQRWRLVEWKPFSGDGAVEYELYDYLEDPLETKNLAGERRDVLEELKALLARHPPARPSIRR